MPSELTHVPCTLLWRARMDIPHRPLWCSSLSTTPKYCPMSRYVCVGVYERLSVYASVLVLACIAQTRCHRLSYTCPHSTQSSKNTFVLQRACEQFNEKHFHWFGLCFHILKKTTPDYVVRSVFTMLVLLLLLFLLLLLATLWKVGHFAFGVKLCALCVCAKRNFIWVV